MTLISTTLPYSNYLPFLSGENTVLLIAFLTISAWYPLVLLDPHAPSIMTSQALIENIPGIHTQYHIISIMHIILLWFITCKPMCTECLTLALYGCILCVHASMHAQQAIIIYICNQMQLKLIIMVFKGT